MVAHNLYRSDSPSGENLAVETEIGLLRAAGVEVVTHVRSSDEIDGFTARQKALLPLRPFRSGEDVRAVEGLIDASRPDVLHLHNPNPLISMSVVDAAKRRGVPVVMSVHNARHTCIRGSFFRDGHPCHDCQGRAPWPGVVHGCYRGSRAQSAAAAGALVAHRGSYRRIDRFLAVSDSVRRELLASGFPAERLTVKPNALPDPGPSSPPTTRDVVFVGRMTEEKGVRLLLDAWQHLPDGAQGTLTLAGSGPLETAAREVAARRSDLVVAGQLDATGVDAVIRRAAAVVIPSVWAEPFGLVALEAYSRSRPVISTGAGGLADFLGPDRSWQVAPEPAAWADALAGLDVAEAARKGAAAREHYATAYSPDAVITQLTDVYAELAGRAALPGAHRGAS
nr:glycosyltransferase [Motilibacter deserti]